MPDFSKYFEFGEFAITTPETNPLLDQRIDDIRAAIQPESILQNILADEIIHAGWEMERVRQLAHHRDAEPQLAAANARASRNWHRARKYLKKLQRAEASHTCASPNRDPQNRADACPLADLTKLPQPFAIDALPTPEVQ